MQKVSTEYKESMKNLLRDRGYILITFGVVNQEAQANASVGDGNFTYYSNSSSLFGDHDDSQVYATLEENFTKVDGSMLFLPRESDDAYYYDTGLVGNPLVSQGQYEVTINLNILAIDFRGLTINFGENYPTDFDIVPDNEQVVEFRDNDQAEFVTEEVFENVTALKIIVYKMKNPNSRFRIYSFRFGYDLVYTNTSVSDSSLVSYVSPISEDIPQIDFSFTVKNYDQYFNVDNPQSAINFFETGQQADIYYGYQLPDGSIEYIRGGHLLCSDWEADDYSATIRCQDVFRNMDSEYYKGVYSEEGKSYYDLALEVLEDAGQTDYYVEPRLKTLYSKNPVPRVTHKEALQIIANACRCVLYQDRAGIIRIESNFIPEAAASCNGETDYSNIENILEDDTKDEYATLATDYTTADGTMFFLPRNTANRTLNTGFVSSELSDANGKFTTNPVITIVQEAICMHHGVKLTFGNALPSGIIFRTYNDSQLVTEYEADEDIVKTLVIIYEFDDFDTMEIEFTGTAEPYNRIVLNNLALGDITDFTMERSDMTSSPNATKEELVSDVVVPYYTYQKGTEQTSLVSEEVTVTAGDTATYYLNDASHDFTALLDEAVSGVTIIESGSYYITLQFEQTGTFDLEVLGYKYSISEQHATTVLSDRGTSVKWENPMIGDKEMASDLSEWLGDYYSENIQYDYSTRGHPEIDANDIIYQENEFYEGMMVRIHEITLNFDQAFSGEVVARRYSKQEVSG